MSRPSQTCLHRQRHVSEEPQKRAVRCTPTATGKNSRSNPQRNGRRATMANFAPKNRDRVAIPPLCPSTRSPDKAYRACGAGRRRRPRGRRSFVARQHRARSSMHAQVNHLRGTHTAYAKNRTSTPSPMVRRMLAAAGVGAPQYVRNWRPRVREFTQYTNLL